MNDHELKKLLVDSGWRHSYTATDGTEEWTGRRDSDAPSLEDIRELVSAVAKWSASKLDLDKRTQQ